MEAGAARSAHAPTLPERVLELTHRVTDLPPVVKVAIGIAALDLTLMVGEGEPDTAIALPDTALLTVALVAVYVGTVAAVTYLWERIGAMAAVVVANIFLVLVIYHGLHDVAQVGLNGMSLGSIVALGAVGLTLVYGILKLVNFAHGDFLTFGAYIAFMVNVTWGLPLIVGVVAAMAMTALLGILFERIMWGPMRARKAGLLQLLLMAIGLALVIRNGIQFVAGSDVKTLDVDQTSTVEFLGLRVGQTELIVIVVGIAVLVAIGLMLRFTLLGKQMRALSDDIDLAETTGIDTERVVLYTWLFAGGLAGLAGVLLATLTNVKPELGFELLLAIFGAVVLGGIGDAFGALVAGLLLGVFIEWSTLVIDSRWKLTIGFVILILALVIRPQGIFGKAKAV